MWIFCRRKPTWLYVFDASHCFVIWKCHLLIDNAAQAAVWIDIQLWGTFFDLQLHLFLIESVFCSILVGFIIIAKFLPMNTILELLVSYQADLSASTIFQQLTVMQNSLTVLKNIFKMVLFPSPYSIVHCKEIRWLFYVDDSSKMYIAPCIWFIMCLFY